eukprot:NODE_43_length_33755_cov_1.178542.p32 type:complete len:123 gc:universal NODE_43_length_33755_cov_1.178542:111-479(+)
MVNLFSLMEVAPNCTDEELYEQYKKLALQKHPDKHGGSHQDFCDLLDVYNFLKTKRKIYSDMVYGNAVIYEEINLKDMEFDGKNYEYDCRCGGNYTLEPIDLKVKFNKIICSNCSLCVEIFY